MIKNIKNTFFALIIGLLIASCTDLNIDVESQYTDENFPTTVEDLEAVCGPAFANFRPNYGRWYWLMVTASTDEGSLVVNGGNWYDNGKYGEMSLHTWNSSNEIVYLNWDNLFSSISQCNQILDILDKAEQTETTERFISEIRAMRAFYYYLATDNYGDLPIIDRMGIETPQRSPRKEVVDFIIKELEECVVNLPLNVDATTYSRPTKYMVYALLAKIYINWPVYTIDDVSNYNSTDANPKLDKAIEYCDLIIESKKYNLSDDWLEKFKDTNGYKIKDFIFAFPYNWETDDQTWGGLTHVRFWCHKFFQETFGMLKKPSGVMRANPEFVDLFTLDGDIRNKIWRGGLQYKEGTDVPFTYEVSKASLDNYYTGADKDAKINWHFELSKELVIRGKNEAEKEENLRMLDLGNDELGLAMGYRNVKFYPTLTSPTHWQSNDMPIFRYADILLIKAEAILRGGTATLGQTAVSLVNEVRTSAQAPLVTDITLDELCDERGRELADEYWRRNDLIRFGQFEKDWGLKKASLNTSNGDKFRRIFPIPFDVMTLNIHWQQNPGY